MNLFRSPALVIVPVLACSPVAQAASASEASYSVSCTASQGCSSSTSGAGGTLSVAQFDSSVGVLTGATLTASFANGATVTYSSTKAGTASFQETVTFGGTSITSTSSTGTNLGLSAFSGSGAIGAADLAALVGTGNVSVGYSSHLTVDKTAFGNTTATASVSGRTLNAAVNYAYLNHANASFTGGTDSNSLSLNAGDGFSVFALGLSSNTTLLDGVNIACTGDCSAFSLNLASFQDLVAGDSVAGTSALIGSLAGHTYNASYVLTFADDGAVGIGQQNNALTLNLTGVTAVPEAETYAMFMAGLLALGTVARRRRRQD